MANSNHIPHRSGGGLNKEIQMRIKNALVWIIITCTISFSVSLIIFLFEKETNTTMDTIGETFWWWVVTITGVGYGDIYPITGEGKMLGTFVILTSLVMFAIVISEVAGLIKLTYERHERGVIRINYKGHIVIYGYSSLTAGIIKMLRSHFGKDQKIVLISNDTKHNPFLGEVDFIHANPIDKETFIEANAEYALASIILANDRFTDPDAYSLVIATGVEMHNPQAVTIVEIMDDEYKALYKEGKIEAFIKRKELLADLLAKNTDSKLVRIIEKETELSGVDGKEAEAKSEVELL